VRAETWGFGPLPALMQRLRIMGAFPYRLVPRFRLLPQPSGVAFRLSDWRVVVSTVGLPLVLLVYGPARLRREGADGAPWMTPLTGRCQDLLANHGACLPWSDRQARWGYALSACWPQLCLNGGPSVWFWVDLKRGSFADLAALAPLAADGAALALGAQRCSAAGGGP